MEMLTTILLFQEVVDQQHLPNSFQVDRQVLLNVQAEIQRVQESNAFLKIFVTLELSASQKILEN